MKRIFKKEGKIFQLKMANMIVDKQGTKKRIELISEDCTFCVLTFLLCASLFILVWKY
jgi:hypothetical protein